MKVIVSHKDSGERYLLLGTGFGVCPATQQSQMYGTVELCGGKEKMPVVALCAEAGEILWVPSEEIHIVEIDGKSPTEWLNLLGK